MCAVVAFGELLGLEKKKKSFIADVHLLSIIIHLSSCKNALSLMVKTWFFFFVIGRLSMIVSTL